MLWRVFALSFNKDDLLERLMGTVKSARDHCKNCRTRDELNPELFIWTEGPFRRGRRGRRDLRA